MEFRTVGSSRRNYRRPRVVQHDDMIPPSFCSCYDVYNPVNILRAFGERMFYVPVLNAPPGEPEFAQPPEPHPKAFIRGSYADDFAKRIDTPTSKVWPMYTDEFVETSPAHKKELYRRAAESLVIKPLEPKDAELQTFLKLEKADFQKKLGVPRLVNPRNPRFNVEWGKFIRPLEKHIYSSINRVFGYEIVAKGMNAFARAAAIKARWDSFKDPIAIGGDARRFDQHVHLRALKWSARVYSQFFCRRDQRRLMRLAKFTWHNRGRCSFAQGFFKWRSSGGRMSGDMDTSLGNILLMCMMLWCLKERAAQIGIRIEFIDDGDDFVMITERQHEDWLRWVSWDHFLAYGFEVDLESTVDIIERIEFCQCHPVQTDSGWKMVRDWKSALPKDLTTVNRSAAEAQTVLKAIGIGGLHAFADVPVLREHYARMAMVRGRAARQQLSGWFWLTKGMHSAPTVSDDTRLSFWRAFGLRPDIQVELERQIRDATPIQEDVDWASVYCLHYPQLGWCSIPNFA